MVPEAAWHLFDINLQAIMPLRMPLFCSNSRFLAYIAPSDAVPGGDAGARGWLQKFNSGGNGLDGVMCAKVKVLCVKFLDYVVKVYFYRVLDVKCNPTAKD
jgi:hypothetical protein